MISDVFYNLVLSTVLLLSTLLFYMQNIASATPPSGTGPTQRPRESTVSVQSESKSGSRVVKAGSNPGKHPTRTHTLRLIGEAHHLTLGVHAPVELNVSSTRSGIYRAEGLFKGQDVSGRFVSSGRRVKQCQGRQMCLIFKGSITLLDTQKWPKGTMTTFSLTLNFNRQRDHVKGVYQIGALQGLDFTQMGTLDLKLKSRE